MTCPFRLQSITWFYRAYQALILLASTFNVLRNRVMALEQQHLIKVMELAEWIIHNSDTTPGKICPDYLCIRARWLIHEQDRKLTVRDVKVLHSVVMITLNARDNSEKLKHMQTDEIRRCQETLDSRDAHPKRRIQRVVEAKEKSSNAGRQKLSSDSDWETIGECSKH
eukprot:476985-Rhodomonas_salina.3